MSITAKFDGSCPRCGSSIKVGDEIEWVRGSKATHVGCTSGKGKKRARYKVSKQPELPPDQRRLYNDTGYTIGAVLYRRELPNGGGPDGFYWTVTYKKWVAREHQWTAHVRPASMAEAGGAMVERLANEAREDAKGFLKGLVGRPLREDEIEMMNVPVWGYWVLGRRWAYYSAIGAVVAHTQGCQDLCIILGDHEKILAAIESVRGQ